VNIVVAERSPTERELDLEIPGSDLSTMVEGKIETYRKKLNLQGFRPGKLPKDVVRKRFGASIRAEAIEELVETSVRKALSERKLLPAGPGSVSDLQAPEGGDVKLKFLFEVDPVLELKDYKGLGVKVQPVSVAQSDVDQRVEQIRLQTARIQKPERPSRTGDLVTARYLRVLVDGVEKPASSPVFQAEIGKGIPAVDKALTGVEVGQNLSIDFEFPRDHAEAEQAGKKARYEVVVEGVYERILPEPTDEWASLLGPFKTFSEFQERVRADLVEGAEREARQKARDEAIDIVLTRNPFPVPRARVEAFVEWQRDRMVRQGVQAPTLQELVRSLGHEAERQIRRQRAVEWIAEKESVKATTEEVDARIKEMADQAGISPEDAREELRKSGRLMEIREGIRFEKTLDSLLGT